MSMRNLFHLVKRQPTLVSLSRPCFTYHSSRFYSAGGEPLTVSQIEDRVLKVLQDFSKVDSSKLSLDAHFNTTLGLDSLDQVEVVMALEDEFNIEIPDRDAEQIHTVREAVEKIFANKDAI